ncbi:hypothetical protein [Actinoplanes sp. G11-F43]|uniref:hypothetical protein n=1 Tax=Actinoplanes sp. G11-F43 TaxID=3424130 RepID=UPI003D35033B
MTWRRWWVTVRVLVVVAWLVAAGVSWWTAPRQVSFEQARADVAADRVVAFQWGDRWEGRDAQRWFAGDTLVSSGTIGPLFAWRTGDGRVFWAETGTYEPDGVVEQREFASAGAAVLGAEIRDAGAEPMFVELKPLRNLVGVVGFALTMLFLGVLIGGPAPVLGTRWFWFWLVVVVPYGLGLLFWMVRDRPWVAGADDGDPRRDNGFLGLLYGLVLSALIPLALGLLSAAVGERWVPV